ncbi:Peptidase S41 family protein ustP [Hypsizygus marmoreus]|uniref:Peptidase S41 family protein ustP n=1 Tax=Hypsizygus marmoreus TaxID=39966 RepID=A0A369K1U4_HYPMA|nr:Peptidase S41 family protein ustP [Hypsizygus marmoreus]
MGKFPKFLAIVASLSLSRLSALGAQTPDLCSVIAGQKWVSPKDVRACFTSMKVDQTLKLNIIDVINKTLAFHTSTNYEIRAPQPFTADVHEELLADLARIRAQSYKSDYDLHIDLSRSVKRLNDGLYAITPSLKLPYIDFLKAAFVNFLPIPLALITGANGTQEVHIAPEAFTVASAEFPDQIDVWQNALPGSLKGKLEMLSGAKVLLIDGKAPFDAVDANSLITGSFQAFGTRQNSFFSSYQIAAAGWTYIMGNFTQQSLPLSDQVTLIIQRVGSTRPEAVTIPYRSRIGAINPFTDTASYLTSNCKAVPGTNGVDIFARSISSLGSLDRPITKFQQQNPISAATERQHPVNVILDASPPSDVVLPPTLVPSLPTVPGSRNAAQFYLLKDGKTGVLALGSFSDNDFNAFLNSMLEGLVALKSQGATQLVVDVSNNGGGFICAAHWLHRIIVGPKSTTIPQAGLDTQARDGPLAQLIVKQIISGNLDPNLDLLYNPLQWTDANSQPFSANEDWLQPPVVKIINGHRDAFSQRLGEECQGSFPTEPPGAGLFEGSKVVIVSNGRCASSCSLFSITMAKLEGAKTVVIGGKQGVKQEYCGTVGGQSTDFSTIDTEIKSTQLKNNTLAPPDLLVNGVQGITWRLGFGINDPTQPEEWQDHPADLNLPVTDNLVNNPVAVWEEVAQRLLA